MITLVCCWTIREINSQIRVVETLADFNGFTGPQFIGYQTLPCTKNFDLKILIFQLGTSSMNSRVTGEGAAEEEEVQKKIRSCAPVVPCSKLCEEYY